MQNITPCLWFDGGAEEAAEFYTSTFKNSRIVGVTHYGEAASEASGMPEGTVLTVEFEIQGQKFLALNGGSEFKLTPAISFIVNCETQQEVDDYWARLTEGGEEVACGWLTDKFGVSWQITPIALMEMISDPDPEKVERVMKAMMPMVKLDIAALKQAYEN